jgi:hypothetical protein
MALDAPDILRNRFALLLCSLASTSHYLHPSSCFMGLRNQCFGFRDCSIRFYCVGADGRVLPPCSVAKKKTSQTVKLADKVI